MCAWLKRLTRYVKLFQSKARSDKSVMATHRTLPGYRSIQCLAIVVLFSMIRSSSEDCSVLNQSKPFIVYENETVGYVLANISVYSLRIDKANFNKYTNLLSVTEEAGRWIIMLNEPLDAETMPNVGITFACQDAAGAKEQSKPMVLIVQDINEYAPQFSAPDSSVNISENWPVGKPFFTIVAEDLDARKVSVQFVYAVVGGDKGYFNITESKGEVFLVKSLDYEAGPTEFTLNISATESLPDGMTNYTSLTINVEDIDDLMPNFTSSVYTLSIPEGNYYGNKSFQTTPHLSAQDGDYHINQSIHLEIDHSTKQLYKNMFAVDQNGLVSVNGSLTAGEYTVLIRASQTDQPELRYAIAVLTITVTDINDHAPSLDKSNYSANVSEAAVPGTVLLIVTAYDDDLGNNSEVTFHLSQSVTGLFAVDTEYHSGIIRLSGSLDREKKAEYDFQVWAKETMTSEGWESPLSSVKITVLDENDNTPTFSQTEYIFNLTRTDKKGDLVGQVRADDPDENLNGEVIYTVKTSKFSYLFEIDEIGNITLRKNLDYQDIGTYNIIVSASDSATVNPRTSYCVVTVNILPVNEHAPIFVNMPYVFHVLETAHVGDFIGQVSAIDVDGDNVVFTMSGNTYYLDFSLSSGKITIAHELDLDSKNSATPQNFTVSVTATDGLHHSITEVEVIILHVNEYSPTFVPHGPFYINDKAAIGTVIANITATDEDVGPDGSVIYSLIQTTTSALFKIDKNSGIITLNCSGQCLDYKRGNYDIIVQASDEGTPPRVSITSVQVQVQKTVFESPEFSEKVYHVSLKENSTVQVSLQLSAEDPDTDQSQLQFYIKNLSSPKVPLSSITVYVNGTVIFSGPFDAEVISSFVVDVAVTDGNSSDNAIIEVNVIGINDHSPTLNITSSETSLPENSTVGTIPNDVTVTVVDENDNSPHFNHMNMTEGVKLTVNKYYITTGVDEELLVNCSFSRAPVGITHLVSLVLSISDDEQGSSFHELVSVDAFDPAEVSIHKDLKLASVSHSFTHDVSKTSYIAVSWPFPDLQSSVFKCDAETLNKYDYDETFTSAVKIHNTGFRLDENNLILQLQRAGVEIHFLRTDYEEVMDLLNKYSDVLFYDSSVIFARRRYTLSKIQFQNINESSKVCEKFGGNLAEIDDWFQYNAIKKFLRNKIDNSTKVVISGQQTENQPWVFPSNGRAVPIFEWSGLIPGYSDEETKQCLALGLVGTEIKMMGVSCDGGSKCDHSAFLCEKKLYAE